MKPQQIIPGTILLMILCIVTSSCLKKEHINVERPLTFEKVIDLQGSTLNLNLSENADVFFIDILKNSSNEFIVGGAYEDGFENNSLGQVFTFNEQGDLLGGGRRLSGCGLNTYPSGDNCDITLLKMVQGLDNSIYLLGSISEIADNHEDNRHSIFVRKTNSNLEEIWTYYDLNSSTKGISIFLAEDNSVIVGGSKIIEVPLDNVGDCSPHEQNYILKLNSIGEKKWVRPFGEIWPCSIHNGKIPFIREEPDLSITAFDGSKVYSISEEGQNIVENEVGLQCDQLDLYWPNRIISDTDAGIIFTWSDYCNQGSPFKSSHISKIDVQGNVKWDANLGNDKVLLSVNKTNDGQLITCGYTFNNNSIDLYLAKIKLPVLDDGEDIVWEQYYGGNLIEFGFDVEETNDGGFMILGSDESISANDNTIIGDQSIYLIKTDSEGRVEL